jgi:hypothetical protein
LFGENPWLDFPLWMVAKANKERRGQMTDLDNTHRRRRRRELRGEPLEQRRGFWQKLRNPNTWRIIVSGGLLIWRFYRLILKFFEHSE